MASVKINNERFGELMQLIGEADALMAEAENIWLDHFADIAQAYGSIDENGLITGFIDDLYKDAESSWIEHRDNFGLVAASAGLISSGLVLATTTAPTLIGPIIGLVVSAIGLLLGIVVKVIDSNTVQFKYDARDVLLTLIGNCCYGEDDTFYTMQNIRYRLDQMSVSLYEVLSKINEYQQTFANLKDTAESIGLNVKMSDDDVTILDFVSNITIGDEQIQITGSEALNAFYTYTNTVMSTELAATYLSDTYGYDIDFESLVNGVNSFAANSIKSGLYTHEFIEMVLPEYVSSSTLSDGYNVITGATGVDLADIESALNKNKEIAGSLALFGGLLGTAFIGNVAKNNGNGTQPTDPGGSPTGGGGGVAPIVTPLPVDPDPEDPEEPPVEPEPEEPEPTDPEPVNDIEIEPINEDIELPEEDLVVELNPDGGEVDYDAIARDEFEFGQEYDDLIAHRTEIIQDIEEKFNSGDLDSIREELKEYGYNSAEIEAIIVDKHKIIKAIIEGDQNAQVAKIARELAEKNGVENFISKYEGRPDYDSLSYEGPSDSLMLPSEDPTIVEAKVAMDEAQTKYEESVATANTLLATATTAKTTMVDLKAKYEEEFGTTDTHMWTEEAVNEYNESIKAYNEAATKADEQIKNVEETKTAYYDSKKEFEDKKEEYRKKAKEEYEKIEQPPEREENGETDTMTPDEIQKQIDQSVVIEGDTISFNANQEIPIPNPESTPAPIGEGEPIPDLVGVSYEE